MSSSVVAVWSHRSVLRLLVLRDLTVKYQQSVLGYFWSLIEPLVMALIYWFIFGILYGAGSGRGHLYPLFVLTGIFPWMWVSTSISEATSALTGQARLITTMKVPRELFPIGRVTGRFAEYLAGLPILFIAALIFKAPFGMGLLYLPLAVLLQFALLTGIALILSSLNVLLRDVERFMRLAQRLLFYVAPVIYPLSKVTEAKNLPGWVKAVYQADPLVGIFQLHHAVFFPADAPSAKLLAVSFSGCAIILLAGWWLFRRLEPAVLKEL